MKNKRCIAAFFACLTMVTSVNVSTSLAQASVGLVDIGLIFESHPTFSQKLEALKLKADQFKSASLQRQQNLMKRAEVLKNYEVGSDNYRNAESQLAQESAKMEVADKDTMRQLMREEARLHYDTYHEVNQAVSEHCKAVGTKLVLRYNSQEMDPKKPSTVMQGVNGSIVFHQPNVDMTQAVIARLVQKYSTASARGNPVPR